jgi:hypothetical protein
MTILLDRRPPSGTMRPQNHLGTDFMARGPKGECRPNDPIAAAAAVLRIATGESTEAIETGRAIAQAKQRRPSPDDERGRAVSRRLRSPND